MKFFVAVKQAEFAAALLREAGFDFAALFAAGDAKALTIAIAAKATASAKPAADVEKVLSEAAQENEALTNKLLAATSVSTSLHKAIAAAGVKIPVLAGSASPQEITAHEPAITDAVKARASTLAQEMVAAAGHPPISDHVVDSTKKQAPAKSNLTGLARVQAAFASDRK